jgi:hypothetical protein
LQYRLLRAVTWRYVSNQNSDSGLPACFYAGRVLDEFLSLLRLLVKGDKTIGLMTFGLHCPDGELSYFNRLRVLCTAFMNHFEIRTEKKLNTSYSVSGCKLIDLLDCLLEHPTDASQVAVSGSDTRCHIKVHYRYVPAHELDGRGSILYPLRPDRLWGPPSGYRGLFPRG